MRRLRTVLVLALSAALAAVPVLPAPAPVVTLECSIRKDTKHLLHLTFAGAAPLPDGAVLEFTLHRWEEKDRRGKLEKALRFESSGTVEVSGGSFSWDQLMELPGLYRVDLDDRTSNRRWEFEFHLWDDELPDRLLAELNDLEGLITRVVGHGVRLQRAIQSRDEWRLRVTPEFSAADEGSNRFRDQLPSLYPAARRNLRVAIRLLKLAPAHFVWNPDGTFGGAFDASADRWIREPDGAPFTVERVVNFLENTRNIARREYSLWIVKDARRVLRENRSRHPDLWALLQGMEGTLDRIETIRRGEPRPDSTIPDPPGPPHILHRKKVREASALLQRADERWHELGDREAPALYRRLLSDFPDTIDELQARVRVTHRAKAEQE